VVDSAIPVIETEPLCIHVGKDWRQCDSSVSWRTMWNIMLEIVANARQARHVDAEWEQRQGGRAWEAGENEGGDTGQGGETIPRLHLLPWMLVEMSANHLGWMVVIESLSPEEGVFLLPPGLPPGQESPSPAPPDPSPPTDPHSLDRGTSDSTHKTNPIQFQKECDVNHASVACVCPTL
jgi:hypothetical protein